MKVPTTRWSVTSSMTSRTPWSHNSNVIIFKVKYMVNGSRYHRALESVSIALALSSALPFTHARSESINADSLNSNFLQLGRRSGGRPQRTVYPRRLPVNTVIHTTLAGIEPTTFGLLVRRASSRAIPTHSSHSETRNRINYPCGSFKRTLS